VVLADVLEHLPDPAALLRDLKNALTDEGLLIASVPNVAHWSVRRNLAFGRFDYEPSGIMDATHLRWFTRSTLTHLVESCGFDVVRIQPTMGAELPIYWAERPWRWLSLHRRRQLLTAALKFSDRLFACQHVVIARPTSLKAAK
jgi:hypothetical protein